MYHWVKYMLDLLDEVTKNSSKQEWVKTLSYYNVQHLHVSIFEMASPFRFL